MIEKSHAVTEELPIANGETGANYSLRHIGNIEEYEDFLPNTPSMKPGSLLPTLRRYGEHHILQDP